LAKDKLYKKKRAQLKFPLLLEAFLLRLNHFY
jgi:hypothetical protein